MRIFKCNINKLWFRLLLLIWTLPLLIVACRAAAAPAIDPEIEAAAEPHVAGEDEGIRRSDEPVELRFTVWTGGEAHLAMLNGIAEAYRRLHPNVTVQFITIPIGEYVSKVTIQLASGDPPDAGWIVESSAPTFIEAGVLADLGPTVKQDPDYNFTDFSESALQLWGRDQAVYGIPFSTSPFLILYNRDMFEAAGIETPDERLAKGEWTWTALAEAARVIAENNPPGLYGFESKDAGVYGAQVWHTLVPMMRAYGGDAWTAGGQCLLDAPESVEAVQLYHDMVFVDGSAVGPGETADFYSGQSAITIAQLSRVSKLAEAPFAWGVAPLPSGPAGKAPVIGQAAIVVFEASEQKEVALDFVAFMTNEANVTTMAEFFPPARASVLESNAMLEANPQIDPAMMEQAVVKAIRSGTVLSSHVEFPKISLAAGAEFDRLWVPDANVQAVLTDVCEAITPFLK